MGGVIGEKVGMGRDGPELDPLRVQTQLLACVKGLFYSHISAVKILDRQLSSKYFKTFIEICHATY